VPPLCLGIAVLWWVHPPSISIADLRSPTSTDDRRAFRPDLIGAFRNVSRPRALLGLCIADALVTTGTAGSLFLLPLLAVDLGVSAETFLLGFGASLLVGAGLSFLGGMLADRLHSKRIYVGNFVAEVAMLSAFALADGPALFAIGVGLYTIQTAFESGYIDYLFSLFEEDETGRVWGLNGTVNKTAATLGPAGGGVLYSLDPHMPFAGGALLVGLGTVVAAAMPRK
jgi:predicted MFS family arabinose efflux permease